MLQFQHLNSMILSFFFNSLNLHFYIHSEDVDDLGNQSLGDIHKWIKHDSYAIPRVLLHQSTHCLSTKSTPMSNALSTPFIAPYFDAKIFVDVIKN